MSIVMLALLTQYGSMLMLVALADDKETVQIYVEGVG
jgi:hypothetical protein